KIEYKNLLQYAKPYWKSIVAVGILMIITGFLQVYPVQYVRQAVDTVVSSKLENQRALYLLALMYVGVSLLGTALRMLQRILASRMTMHLIHDLRTQVYDHAQRLSLSFYENTSTGDIMSRALGDVGAVAGGLLNPLSWLLGVVVRLVWVIWFLARMNGMLTIISLSVTPLLLFAITKLGAKVKNYQEHVRQSDSELWTILNESIRGIKEVKVFQRETKQSLKFKEKSWNNIRWSIRETFVEVWIDLAIDIMFVLGGGIVLFYGGVQALLGNMSPGDLTAFLMLQWMLYSPIIEMSYRYDELQKTLVSAKRVFEILSTPQDIVDAPDSIELSQVDGLLEFKNVSFRYEGASETLNQICLRVEPGETIALVGHSGGGKSTLVKLIPRLYEPQEGEITLDGYDIRRISIKTLRQNIAVVFQDSFLFNTSLRENILFGKPDVTEEEMFAAARAAHVDDFARRLPQGYDTYMGEGGVKLSGGERQRVCIARALLRNPRILIMDEATSSVDTETEIKIQEALRSLFRGRTNFIIAHRLSTILDADKIVVVDGGRLIEQGTHEELIEKKGAYSRMYKAQFEKPLVFEL
ncbi:ABC transporter ATP-binding protein, partial [bacterium]|nr:ABC transporter ATP-binding protein [bacterium]